MAAVDDLRFEGTARPARPHLYLVIAASFTTATDFFTATDLKGFYFQHLGKRLLAGHTQAFLVCLSFSQNSSSGQQAW